MYTWGFPDGSVAKRPPASAGEVGSVPGSGRPLRKEMETHYSILAWEIPQTEEPGSPWDDGQTRLCDPTVITNKAYMQYM